MPVHSRQRPARVRLLLLVTLVALLTLGSTTAIAASAGPLTTDVAAEAVADTAAEDTEPSSARPLVLIGFTGVRWEDLSPETTPALWSVAERSALASLVVRNLRASTCPADGWLAVSSGSRAADLPSSDRTTDTSGLSCRPLLEAEVDPADATASGVAPVGTAVPGWQDYATANAHTGYVSRIGLLGDEVAAAGVPAAGIGPGAAIALATGEGLTAGTIQPRPDDPLDLTTAVVTLLTDAGEEQAVASPAVDLLVVDAGEVRTWTAPPAPAGAAAHTPPDEAEFRAAQIDLVEARVAAVLAGLEIALGPAALERTDPASPLVVTASLADAGRAPALQMLAALGDEPGMLVTSSTRQTGFVLATDLTPWFLDTLGLEPTTAGASALVGAGPRVVPGEATAQAGIERIESLVGMNAHAQAQRPIIAPFYLLLVIANVALYALVALGLTRPSANRFSSALARWLRLDASNQPLTETRPRVLRSVRAISVALAAVPVSTFLANLLPWWRVTPPALGFTAATAVFVAGLTALALARPWRDRVLAPLAIVAGATALVLGIDVLTGARLQISAIMGAVPLVAGRFYGFSNTSFALFTTATILLAVTAVNPLVRRGKRLMPAIIVAIIGVITTVLDGAPSIGADFGGPPAIVPAFAILALIAGGVRITWRRVVLVLGGAALATAAFAVIDYQRPVAQRSHLGRFVETVLDGGAWEVVVRKLEANLRILANNRPLTILAIAGIALVVFVLARPVRRAITAPSGGQYAWLSSGAPISRMGSVTPMLGPGLVALAIAMGIGFALNDSGIAIPAYGVTLAVPLVLAACASWMLPLGAGGGGGRSAGGQEPAGQQRSGQEPTGG